VEERVRALLGVVEDRVSSKLAGRPGIGDVDMKEVGALIGNGDSSTTSTISIRESTTA
jgi:hypothetical protein